MKTPAPFIGKARRLTLLLPLLMAAFWVSAALAAGAAHAGMQQHQGPAQQLSCQDHDAATAQSCAAAGGCYSFLLLFCAPAGPTLLPAIHLAGPAAKHPLPANLMPPKPPPKAVRL